MTLSLDQRRSKLALGLQVVNARAHALARRFPRADVAELVGAGHLAIVEALERAVDEQHFDRYLSTRSRGAMLDALGRRERLPIETTDVADVADQSRSADGPDVLQHQLERAMASLPSRARTLVRMRYVEDRTFLEIAKVLGITESGACQMDRAAIERLRRELGVDCPGGRHAVRLDTAERDAARKMRAAGASLSVIAATFRISRTSAHRHTIGRQ